MTPEGVTNKTEVESDPNMAGPNSDCDGLTDVVETNDLSTNPFNSNTDANKLSYYLEIMAHMTNLIKANTNGDNLKDAFKIDN